jgi:hypothetical protein
MELAIGIDSIFNFGIAGDNAVVATDWYHTSRSCIQKWVMFLDTNGNGAYDGTDSVMTSNLNIPVTGD